MGDAVDRSGNIVCDQVLEECQAMASYALSAGFQVPNMVSRTLAEVAGMSTTDPDQALSKVLGQKNVANLNKIHNILSTVVAPATPAGILFLAKENRKPSPWSFLGKVPLVRRMMLTALVFLVLFVGLSLSVDVNFDGGNILDSNGMPLLKNLLFYLSSAGLGACFAALFKANKYIAKGTFNPEYEPAYWTRIMLGIIAGLFLSEMVPMSLEASQVSLGRPTLALVGGFSASLVFRILQRLVETVESLVRGSTQELIESREQAAQLKYREQKLADRAMITEKLIQLKGSLAAASVSEELFREIDELLEDLVPGKSSHEAP